ncbi:unnamed protein product [Soboliphyme baturini]|uniref:Helitron_like_N domain-containing protein n=1 Tax=Soboliphyme baturini TaxID=241478 RepID=A0A183IFE6_9BILA|nr:unnamed protein product [Soboliphyme baturini]
MQYLEYGILTAGVQTIVPYQTAATMPSWPVRNEFTKCANSSLTARAYGCLYGWLRFRHSFLCRPQRRVRVLVHVSESGPSSEPYIAFWSYFVFQISDVSDCPCNFVPGEFGNGFWGNTWQSTIHAYLERVQVIVEVIVELCANRARLITIILLGHADLVEEIDRLIGSASGMPDEPVRAIVTKDEVGLKIKLSLFKSIFIRMLIYGQESGPWL